MSLTGQALTAADLGGSASWEEFGGHLAAGDFDGDGFEDVAVGAPSATVGGAAVAGAVYIAYGSPAGATPAGAQVFTQDTPGVSDAAEFGDRFGHALAVGDFDGDGFDDLAIGVFREDIGAATDTGAVHVLYGSASGLSTSGEQLFHQDTPGLLGVNESGDEYGSSLAAGDFDGDGFDELVIGVPGQELSGFTSAGMIAILRGSVAGLTTVGNGLLAQDFPDVLGTPNPTDLFGASLASGNFNGDAYADLAVGVPNESDGAGAEYGSVAIFYGSTTGITTTGNQIWNQNSPGVLGIAELGDHFGSSLASADFDGDGFQDLAIGIPDEELGGVGSAGNAEVLYGGAGGLSATGNQLLGIDQLGETPQTGDTFGYALSGGDFDGDGFDDLAVGAPGVDVCNPLFPCTTQPDAGRAYLYVGGAGGLTDDFHRPIDPDAAANRRSGQALAGGDLDGDGFDELVVGRPALSSDDSIMIFSGNGCGNGLLDPGEACDDGNDFSGDGCSSTCVVEFCGDSVVQPSLGESCDDGNNVSGDGCSATCANELCGDSVVQPSLGETCDDGNNVSLDGCSDVCTVEDALTIAGNPAGGSVLFTVEGVPLSIATTSALTLEQVAQVIALAINNDPTLTVLGISAQAVGTTVYMDGALSDVSTTDPGLLLYLSGPTQCNDGLDNDGDALVDLADPDCTSGSDPFEGVGVLGVQKLSDTSGYLSSPGSPGSDPGGLLADGDQLGAEVTSLGDLDGDGVPDVAIGAYRDDLGGVDAGTVYILFLNADGTVKARQKIGEGVGGLSADLDAGDGFGSDVALVHDVDGDGVPELAVAAPGDDDGGADAGALYLLFLNPDGTVKAEQKISNLSGGLGAVNDAGDGFGNSPADIGDLDGDGVTEIAVGSFTDNAAGGNAGSLYILFLHRDGTVRASQKITEGVGGFTGILDTSDRFGSGLAHLGDLDGDGKTELAVGARFDGSNDAGVVYLLSLNLDGTVASYVVIEGGTNGFVGPTESLDRFSRPARVGDLDGDGVADLAVGAVTDDDGAVDAGAVWILFLNPDGSVHGERKISALPGLEGGDFFGGGVTSPGDLDGDGVMDLVVGTPGDDDGGTDRGAAYVLFLDGAPAVCGNGVLDPLEECDDGGNVSGDLCSATCESETWLQLVAVGGTADGGSVTVTVDGNVVPQPTTSGQTVAQVLTALAAAIQAADPDLEVTVSGDVLYTNGSITDVTVADTGLLEGPVPESAELALELSFEVEPFLPTTLDLHGQGFASLLRTPQGRIRSLGLLAGVFDTPVAVTIPGTGLLDPRGFSASTLLLSYVSIYDPLLQSGAQGAVLFGSMRICLLLPCGAGGELPIPIPMDGIGLGSVWMEGTASFTHATAYNGVWTFSTATTSSPQAATITARGFLHGPASNSMSAGLPGGVLQLVTPTRVTYTGPLGSSGDFAMITRLTMPEPSSPLVLAAGGSFIVGLAKLRRRR